VLATEEPVGQLSCGS